jgi:tetratricopeptide (TPR) repeat protein
MRLQFVGREDKKKDFVSFLKDDSRRVLLVIGKTGIGKSRLLEEFRILAHSLNGMGCITHWQDIAQTDESEQYLNNLIHSFGHKPGVLFKNRASWDDIFYSLAEDVPVLKHISKIAKAVLQPSDVRSPAQKLIEIILKTSEQMREKHKLVIFVDPRDELKQPHHLDTWRTITARLPYNVKVVFAQREHDVLVESTEFRCQDNVMEIELDFLGDKDTEKIVRQELIHRKPSDEFVQKFVGKYKGYVLHIDAVLKLLRDKELTPKSLDELPSNRLTEQLYDRLSGNARNLIDHLAILEVPVDIDFLVKFTALKKSMLTEIERQPEVRDVLDSRNQSQGLYKLYHQTLIDHILKEFKRRKEEPAELHKKASKVFFDILKKNERDPVALEYSTKHLLLAGDQESKKAYVDAVWDWYDRKSTFGMFSLCKNELTNGLQLSEELKLDERTKAAFLGNLGIVFHDLGDYQQAKICQELALEILKRIGDARGEAKGLGNLGNLYSDLGDNQQAKICQEQALEIDRRIGDERGEAQDLGNLGLVFSDLLNYQQAKTCQELALEILKRIGDEQGKAQALGNLGNIYKDLGDIQKAEDCYEHALEIDKKIGNKQSEARQLGNLGLLYEKKGELHHALNRLQTAKEIFERIGDKPGLEIALRAIERVTSVLKDNNA